MGVDRRACAPGLPTMTLTRAAFGFQGNRFNGVLGWVTSVSFEALNTVFGVLAITALLPVLGWHHSGAAGKIIALVVVFFLSAADRRARARDAGLVPADVRVPADDRARRRVLLHDRGGQLERGPGASAVDRRDDRRRFFAGVAVIASGPLSYMFNSSDWPRYLPARHRASRSSGPCCGAPSGISIFLGVMGVILSSRGNMSNPVAGVQPLIPNGCSSFTRSPP